MAFETFDVCQGGHAYGCRAITTRTMSVFGDWLVAIEFLSRRKGTLDNGKVFAADFLFSQLEIQPWLEEGDFREQD